MRDNGGRDGHRGLKTRHAPAGATIVETKDGLVYLKISFMGETRWVVDVMYTSGVRRTYDLEEGHPLPRGLLAKALRPDLEHWSHAAVNPVIETVLHLFSHDGTVRLGLSGINRSAGVSAMEGGDEVWDRCVLSAVLRAYKGYGYEIAERAVMRHYGLDQTESG